MARPIEHNLFKPYIPCVVRLSEMFQTEETITVEWMSPRNNEVSLFKGLYKYEKGSSETFMINGKPGYCAMVLEELAAKGMIIDKRSQSSSIKFWIHLSGKKV